MVTVLLLALLAHAADHIDGSHVTHRRAADLSDLYAWTPEPGRLVAAVSSRPFSGRRARFQDELTLRVIVRRAALVGGSDALHTDTGDELRIDCAPARGRKRAEDTVRCEVVGPLGAREVLVAVGEVAPPSDLRVFAGPRRDPFFIQTGAVDRARPRDGDRRPPRGPDGIWNAFLRSKVLALVVELDVRALLGDGEGLLAVAAESDWEGHRADRTGRPEVTGFILASRWGEGIEGEDVRNAWNAEPTFALSPGHRAHYVAAMSAGLARLDALDRLDDDAPPDWPSPHPLATVLLTDALIVDPTVPCDLAGPTLLEIELAAWRGLDHATCGGRTPNADAVDAVLTLFQNGPDRVAAGPPWYGPAGAAAPRRSDGIDRSKNPASPGFPYLAAP